MTSHIRVPAEDVTPERLDTGFYSAEYYAARRKIGSIGVKIETIGDVCEPWQFGAYALCNDIVWSARSGGVPYIKTEAIKSPLIDEDGLSYVTQSTHLLLEKSSLKAGDIIVSTSGTVGRIAVLPASIPIANSNQDTIKFSLSGTAYDPYYVAAWLTTRHAQAYMEREAGGAVQQHIYLYNFRRLPLLGLTVATQQYIGEKVRQAERLRAWAKTIQKDASGVLPQYFESFQERQDKSYRVKTSVISEVRLDSHFYHPRYLLLGEKLEEVCCEALGSACGLARSGWIQSTGSFYYYKIGGLDTSTGTIAPSQIACSAAPSRATTSIQFGDVLVSTVRPNRKNVAFVVDTPRNDPMVATSGFAVLRFPTPTHAAFYHTWLRSNDATAQLMRWNSGSAYPAIDENVPLAILAPKFDDVFIENWGARLLDAQFALLLGTRLTDAAKLLVESLIEGKITESQLIAAQQALDAGDDNLDRAILARLKTDGFDGAGEPMFPDLDQLYDLLERAKPEAEA